MSTDLLKIPGVGSNMKQHLVNIGYYFVEDLVGKDPENIYNEDCTFQKKRVDRCVLYVYRLAVYFANTPNPDTDKLQWWKWKD